MAQYVNWRRLVSKLAIGYFVVASMAVCSAQELKDPTRPPNLLQGAGEGEHVPVLQSVLLAPNRKFAVIDGTTVKLNGKFGDQVLVRLTETEATLKRGKVLQTLKLFPDVEKKIIKDPKVK